MASFSSFKNTWKKSWNQGKILRNHRPAAFRVQIQSRLGFLLRHQNTSQCVPFKIILLFIQGTPWLCSTSHIQNCLSPHTVRPGLRSTSCTLFVPWTCFASYRESAFSCIAPRLWNSLPENLGETHNISLFQLWLETHHTCFYIWEFFFFFLFFSSFFFFTSRPVSSVSAHHKCCDIIITMKSNALKFSWQWTSGECLL